MGSASSKAARKFPAKGVLPSTARAPPPAPAPTTGPQGRAEDHKSDAIKQDAADPDFLKNLHRLGPVTVDHHTKAFETTQKREAQNTSRLFETRQRVDEEAFSAKLSQNHLYSYALSEMLDARKAAQTPRDVEVLAKKYNVDAEKLSRLVRFVNSPSVDSSKIRQVDEKNEEKGMILPAIWIEPRLRQN